MHNIQRNLNGVQLRAPRRHAARWRGAAGASYTVEKKDLYLCAAGASYTEKSACRRFPFDRGRSGARATHRTPSSLLWRASVSRTNSDAVRRVRASLADERGQVPQARRTQPADESSDLHFVLCNYGTFSARFGLWRVPTTRTVRGSPEHAPSSSPDTVSTNLKNQRNSKSTNGTAGAAVGTCAARRSVARRRRQSRARSPRAARAPRATRAPADDRMQALQRRARERERERERRGEAAAATQGFTRTPFFGSGAAMARSSSSRSASQTASQRARRSASDATSAASSFTTSRSSLPPTRRYRFAFSLLATTVPFQVTDSGAIESCDALVAVYVGSPERAPSSTPREPRTLSLETTLKRLT